MYLCKERQSVFALKGLSSDVLSTLKGETETLPTPASASNVVLLSGAPNDNFRKIICSEDDLTSRIFGTFVVKFLLACLS